MSFHEGNLIMKKYIILICLFSLISTSVLAEKTKSLRWKIKQESWNPNHELVYKDFIHRLGLAVKSGTCHTTNECLKSAIANPLYFKMNPNRLDDVFTDCADLPYILRAYFSWMNDLPFSYATELEEAKTRSSKSSDIRYSPFGNIVTSKRTIRTGNNINKIFQELTDTISSATFRTNASMYDSGELFRDTYPVDIDRSTILPGTVLYDANGHVAVVYEVTGNGKIHLIDAHPDNSLTAITYGEKFSRTSVMLGGGFSNFRSFSVSGNIITPTKNYQIPGYSLIQFQKGPFHYKGQDYSFYEYVRLKLADGVIIYNPIGEFSDFLDELCSDMKDRELAVNSAIDAGIPQNSHPIILPENIYGADGVWEVYATPSRDARLKASIREGKNFLTKVIIGNLYSEIKLNYNGTDLVGDLREIYLKKTNQCLIHPTKTSNLTLDTIMLNLFSLSFDPYHSPELRWGTQIKSDQWYKAEQGLRNRIDRDYSMKTNYNVEDLPNAPVSATPKPELSYDQILEIKRSFDLIF